MINTVTRPPETVALADWLVGPFSYDTTGTITGELAEWQVPFYDIARNGLLRIAGLREDAELPPDFQPDPLAGVELYRELEFDRRVHGMINGSIAYVEDYKSGVRTTKLRPHQRDIMDVLVEETVKVGANRQINIKSPTGSGKTAVMVTTVEALKYKDQPNNKARALVLVPSKEVLFQTMQAFKDFTDLEAVMYFGESKQVGDVTVMTYQSFKSALARGDINEDSFDVVARDENDTFSKHKTGQLIDDYCQNSPTGRKKLVYGFSATPREEQNVVYERTILDSIRDRQLAPLAVYQRHTQSQVHDRDADWREEFRESEVSHLMFDEDRNGIIVDEVLSGLASGRRVMARCIPGKDMLHPEIIKDLLLRSGRNRNGVVKIQHPYVGDIGHRQIRPVVIKGDMPTTDRRLLTGMFNNHLDDRIDVLLFVGTLIRGFDSPVAKKIINAAPTRSPSLEEQLLGRGMRWFLTQSGNVMSAQAVDLVDNVDGGQVTFEDIINRDAPDGYRYRQGAIIGPDLADLRDHGSAPGSAFERISVEELARAARLLGMHGLTMLGEVSLLTTKPEALEGRAAAQAIGAAALLRTAKVLSKVQVERGGHIQVTEAARRLGVTTADVMLTAQRMRVGVGMFIPGGGAPRHYFSDRAFERLSAKYGNAGN